MEVEKNLNEVWFGTYKLIANLPKYSRTGNTKGGEIERKRMKEKGTKDNITHKAIRRSEMSYAEAITGKICPNEASNSKEMDEFRGLSYKSEESEKLWLKDCLTGVLKDKYSWVTDGESIQQECGQKLITRYMGGDLVLIQSASGEKTVDAIAKQQDWSLKWFESVQQWSESDVHSRRTIWTQWYGVSLHAWNEKFFRMVSTKIGTFVRADNDTISRRKIQMARILVKTSYPEIPRIPLKVAVDGRIFSIRIKEEDEEVDDDCDERLTNDFAVDDDEDPWSEEKAEEAFSDEENIREVEATTNFERDNPEHEIALNAPNSFGVVADKGKKKGSHWVRKYGMQLNNHVEMSPRIEEGEKSLDEINREYDVCQMAREPTNTIQNGSIIHLVGYSGKSHCEVENGPENYRSPNSNQKKRWAVQARAKKRQTEWDEINNEETGEAQNNIQVVRSTSLQDTKAIQCECEGMESDSSESCEDLGENKGEIKKKKPMKTRKVKRKSEGEKQKTNQRRLRWS